jgi:predicted TIM-barrel fold metal-dependent hydrolase
MIVDAQIHLWGNAAAPPHHRSQPLGADEAVHEMRVAGVDRAINCPAIWDPDANAIGNAAARQFPDRLATTGWFPLSPVANEEIVRNWKQQPGMLGLRFVIINEQQMSWLATGALDWIWRAAEKWSVPVAFAVRGGLAHVERIATLHPRLRITIDHMGAGHAGKVPDVFGHFPELLRLAGFANVAVKATAAPGYATDGYPFRSVHDHLHKLFDAYGPDRMFWGTDITRMPCTWRECVTMFSEELSWLQGRDRDLVMGHALCNWLAWSVE